MLSVHHHASSTSLPLVLDHIQHAHHPHAAISLHQPWVSKTRVSLLDLYSNHGSDLGFIFLDFGLGLVCMLTRACLLGFDWIGLCLLFILGLVSCISFTWNLLFFLYLFLSWNFCQAVDIHHVEAQILKRMEGSRKLYEGERRTTQLK